MSKRRPSKPKQPTRRRITGKIPEETPVLKPKQPTRKRITGKIPEETPVPEAKQPTRRFKRGLRKDTQETPVPTPPAKHDTLAKKTTVRASSEPSVSVKHTIDDIIKSSNLPPREQALLPAHRLTTKAARPKKCRQKKGGGLEPILEHHNIKDDPVIHEAAVAHAHQVGPPNIE